MSTSTRKHKNHLYSDVEKLKESLVETGLDIKNLLGDTYYQSMENVKDTGYAYKNSMSHYIAKNPFKAVGISIATGLLIGYLLKK